MSFNRNFIRSHSTVSHWCWWEGMLAPYKWGKIPFPTWLCACEKLVRSSFAPNAFIKLSRCVLRNLHTPTRSERRTRKTEIFKLKVVMRWSLKHFISFGVYILGASWRCVFERENAFNGCTSCFSHYYITFCHHPTQTSQCSVRWTLELVPERILPCLLVLKISLILK